MIVLLPGWVVGGSPGEVVRATPLLFACGPRSYQTASQLHSHEPICRHDVGLTVYVLWSIVARSMRTRIRRWAMGRQLCESGVLDSPESYGTLPKAIIPVRYLVSSSAPVPGTYDTWYDILLLLIPQHYSTSAINHDLLHCRSSTDHVL